MQVLSKKSVNNINLKDKDNFMKFILMICASIIGTLACYAQQEQKIGVDGLELGMKSQDAVFVIGTMQGFKLDDKQENESAYYLCYYKKDLPPNILQYTLFFDKTQDKAFAIEKLYLAGDNRYFVQNTYQSRYADMLYKYGNPIVKDETSSVWRLKEYKITLAWVVFPYNNGITIYGIREFYEHIF